MIKITDIEENSLFTELSPEEMTAISGGGFWDKVTKSLPKISLAIPGAVAGFLIGGPTGAFTGAKVGWCAGGLSQQWVEGEEIDGDDVLSCVV